jgi:AraC family transcriptional regulator
MQQPRIERINERHLIGLHTLTSLANDKTRALWKSFMPRLMKYTKRSTLKLYSIQIYERDFGIETFNPDTEFIKWAAVDVCDINKMPDDMEMFLLPGGLYAVFLHMGPASAFQKTFQYIYGQWLPHSGYVLDERPHFEIMDENYPGPDHPEAEEEVWIPVKLRSHQ